MPDRDPPRIVATNTAADIARAQAMRDVSSAVRELAANLLRVIRGAGKPDTLGRQAEEFVQALGEYQEAMGHGFFVDDLTAMLRLRRDHDEAPDVSDAMLDRLLGEKAVVAGALQIVASRLVGQAMHEQKGKDEMQDGMRLIEEARAELRREAQRAVRVAVASKTKAKRVKSRKT